MYSSDRTIDNWQIIVLISSLKRLRYNICVIVFEYQYFEFWASKCIEQFVSVQINRAHVRTDISSNQDWPFFCYFSFCYSKYLVTLFVLCYYIMVIAVLGVCRMSAEKIKMHLINVWCTKARLKCKLQRHVVLHWTSCQDHLAEREQSGGHM